MTFIYFKFNFYMAITACVSSAFKILYSWGPNPRKDLATSTDLRFRLFIYRLIFSQSLSSWRGFSFSIDFNCLEDWGALELMDVFSQAFALASRSFPTSSWHTPRASMSHFSALPELVKECCLKEISFTFSERFFELHVISCLWI